MSENIEIVKCPNCSKEFEGDFCNHCGQKRIIGRLNFKTLLLDFINTTFLIDAPIVRTVKELLLSPGEFYGNYLNGRRKVYLQPIQFFILLLTIYLLILNWVGVFELTNQEFLDPQFDNNGPDKVKEFTSRLKGVPVYIKKNINIFYFLLPPYIALFFKNIFKKLDFNYSESLVLSFYLIGMVLLISLFALPFSIISLNAYFTLKFLILALYIPFAFMQLAKSRNVKDYFKSILVIGLSYFFYMVTIGIFTVIHFLLK